MTSLFVSPDADDELEALAATEVQTVALIDALLESVADNPAILEVLNRPHNHFEYVPSFEIKKFSELQQRGKNVFIIKIWDEEGKLLPYRCLYAHDPQRDRYHVLMIAHRDFDYDNTHPDFIELVRRYDELGLRNFKI